MPEGSYETAAAKPAFDPASMQAFRTADPDEIRRRWGDLEHLVGGPVVNSGKGWTEFGQHRWHVSGALQRAEYLTCYESTRKCDESWFWIQYDPESRNLNYINSSGILFARGTVRPDGSVSRVNASGTAMADFRFDYDEDEGVYTYPDKTTVRSIPTDANQFADLRKQWKQVDAETRAEEQRIAQERAAERRRAEREADAERWNNVNRAMAGLGQAYRDTAEQHRRQQAQSAALNARIAQAQQQSRPVPSTSSATRTPVPSTSTLNRPTATTLAPSPLTPLPSVPGRTASSSSTPSSRTPVPLRTNPLQPPRLSEETLVAPQQPQARSPVPSTTTSAPAKVAPPTKMVTVPVPYKPEPEPRTVKPAPTVVATAPPTLRDPSREWEERRQRDERGEGGDRRDPGKASTRDDPKRCITGPIEADPEIGSRSACKAFRVYNRCAAPVEIRTCVYLTDGKRWSCELKSGVAPNAYKQHESCSPHRERFVSVKYSDDHKTRMAMP